MENKRKASAAGRGGGADGGEPAAKRRKLPSVSLVLFFVCGDNPSCLRWSAPWSTAAKSFGSESISGARARLVVQVPLSSVARARPRLFLPSSPPHPHALRRPAVPLHISSAFPLPPLHAAFNICVATLLHGMQAQDTLHACTANHVETCIRTSQTWQSMNPPSLPPPTAWLFSKQYARQPTNSTSETRASPCATLATHCGHGSAASRYHDSLWHSHDMRAPILHCSISL